jgi:hypothetical protein
VYQLYFHGLIESQALASLINSSLVSSVLPSSSHQEISGKFIIPKNAERYRCHAENLSTVFFILEIHSLAKN